MVRFIKNLETALIQILKEVTFLLDFIRCENRIINMKILNKMSIF